MTAQIIAADDKTQLTGLNLAYTGRVQQIFILPSSSYTDKNIYLSADGTAWTNDATELYNMTHKTDIGTYTLYWKKGASGTQNGPVTASIQNATLSMSALQSVIANNTFNQIVFSVNMTAPAFGAFDVSAEQNGGIMAWTNNDTLCIASSAIGQKVEAPADCSNMLSGLSNVVALDLSGLDTKNTTNMSNMFKGLGENVTNHDIHIIGLSTLNTSKVANATSMFENVARNASVVYAPYFNQISFPSGATKTNWNKNFAQKATTKELGAPTEQPNGEGDTVTLDNGMVYMYAGSLHSMTIIAAQWTAQYNGTPIADITQLDYLRCTVPFQGEGVYTFEGVLKDITGTTINSHVETDVYVETEQMNADITITRNDITMYAVDMANKNIVTGTWTVTRDGEELSTNDIQIVDALTVKIPNRGNATYMFTGSLIDTSGMMYKVQIVTLVDTQGDVAYKVGDNVEMFAGSLLNEDIVAGQWVVKFNGTEITTVTQIDYLSCVIPYQGAGTYLFEGTLQNAQGEPVYSTIIQILE